jgi:two-component system sensor histidine kinase/response regulator
MGNRPLAILIVDDFETMRKVTASQLASLGLDKADTASDGVEALRMLEKKRYDLVISDWNMPNMTGIDLLRNVRAHEKLAHLPFVMITAEAERQKIVEAIGCGVSDLLVKPYAASRLGQAVEHAMNNRPRIPKPVVEAAPEAQAAAAPAAFPVPSVPRQPSLLLVDDTADNLHLLSEIFTGDYRIRAAHNGQKALDICCSDSPPDLVLLDVMMPGMDGFEVAARMREHPNAENVPIIFVTAMTEADARLKGLSLGAVDFVTKPIDPVTLKLRVDNFIRYVELRRQVQADYDNLLAMARLRDDVDAMTRHDLKGPLSGALGVVQSMMEHDDLDRRQIEQLRMSEQAMLQVMNMINLSTELYKIETKRFVLDPVPIPIGDLLRRVAETARIAYSSKHLSIVVDADVDVGIDPASAMGEPTLCYSLISNLLKNACEAAPPNSKVSLVSTDADPQRIAISNTGAVPPAIREHFFEKFVTAGKQGGTGLGTYSARLLARAQLGDVELEVSDEHNITTLTVTLPSAPKVPMV